MAEVWGCPPARASGESSGRRPLAEVWGCTPSACKRGVQRGATPLAGGMESAPPAHASGESRGSNPSGRRNGGCASYSSHACRLTERAERQSLFARGSRGCPPGKQQNWVGGWAATTFRPDYFFSCCKRESRGRRPMAGVWGCPPAHASGESRGVQPHWQEEWRMCLHNPIIFTSPPSVIARSLRRGNLGWGGRACAGTHPRPGVPPTAPDCFAAARNDGPPAAPLWRPGACPPQHVQAGSPEGCNPTGRRNGECSPSACKRGVQRGATPLAGGMEDVPP